MHTSVLLYVDLVPPTMPPLLSLADTKISAD